MKLRTAALLLSLASITTLATAHGNEGHKTAGPVKMEQKPWGIAGNAKAVSRTIEIGMTDAMRFTPDQLEVRELQYRVHRKGLRVKRIILVTPLLDAARYPVEALAQLYYARWGIATNFAHVKTPMGLDVLKGKTVDGVLKELSVFALIYNLVRLVMAQAARRQQVAIDRISFIDAVRWLAAARDNELLPPLVLNPHRPYRYEPRVRKRRPKQYPLMQKPPNELRKSLANNTNAD